MFVVLPNAQLPAGTLQSFQAWNQVTPGGSPGPSAGNVFNAYVLRPTATPNEYTVVYDSGPLTVPVSAIPAGEVATFTVPAVTVQLNDVIGFYGRGIPVDTGITVSPDTFSHPATADPALIVNQAPAVAATIGIGVDPGFPLPRSRTARILRGQRPPHRHRSRVGRTGDGHGRPRQPRWHLGHHRHQPGPGLPLPPDRHDHLSGRDAHRADREGRDRDRRGHEHHG